MQNNITALVAIAQMKAGQSRGSASEMSGGISRNTTAATPTLATQKQSMLTVNQMSKDLDMKQ
jgi:hypothetical protein